MRIGSTWRNAAPFAIAAVALLSAALGGLWYTWTYHPFTDAGRRAKVVRERLSSPELPLVPNETTARFETVDLGLFSISLSRPIAKSGLDGEDIYLGFADESAVFVESLVLGKADDQPARASETLEALTMRLMVDPRAELRSEDRLLLATKGLSESEIQALATTQRGGWVHANGGMGWFQDERLSAAYGCSGGHFSVLYICSAQSQVAAFINIASPSPELRLQLACDVVGSFALPESATTWTHDDIAVVWTETLARFDQKN